MLKLKVKAQVAAAILALTMILSASAAQAVNTAKNVIFMISDGWGYNQIKATNFYNGTSEAYENFSTKFAMTTYSASNTNTIKYDPTLAWSDFNYVKAGATDSASAATAMATGIKNYDGQLNWSTTGQPLKTIVEIAAERGKATGAITSVEFSHATPAGMYAHNESRNNYDQIAREMLGVGEYKPSPLNVIMGAGNPRYNDNGQYQGTPKTTKYVGGDATWDTLRSINPPGNWSLIESKSDFENLATSPTTPERVVGVVQVHTTLQQSRTPAPGSNVMLEHENDTPLNANVPSLATMTKGALNVLDNDPDGFFLMIEGGAVDWANHANQLGRLIQEQTEFNDAVDAVIAWINANGGFDKNLLIVTGDHECGYLTQAENSFDDVIPNPNGADYLPIGFFNSGDHTNSLIPLFAEGPGSELFAGLVKGFDPKRGEYIDNTDIFRVMQAQIVATPIPGSVLLLGSGMMGMFLIGIRRRSA